jgi:hypothetical protein
MQIADIYVYLMLLVQVQEQEQEQQLMREKAVQLAEPVRLHLLAVFHLAQNLVKLRAMLET